MAQGFLYFILLAILQFIRVRFNQDVYNELHPKKPISLRFERKPSIIFDSVKKVQDYEARSFDRSYLFWTFFWIKYPRSKRGKIKAWCVLMISIISVLVFIRLGLLTGDSELNP